MKNIQHNVIVTVLAGIALMLVSSQSNAQTGLGCSSDLQVSPNASSGSAAGRPDVATCSIAADCAPVGGVDCTSGACYCPDGPIQPFCACLASGTTTGAPLLSFSGLIALVGVLCAVGIYGVWRRLGGQRQAA